MTLDFKLNNPDNVDLSDDKYLPIVGTMTTAYIHYIDRDTLNIVHSDIVDVDVYRSGPTVSTALQATADHICTMLQFDSNLSGDELGIVTEMDEDDNLLDLEAIDDLDWGEDYSMAYSKLSDDELEETIMDSTRRRITEDDERIVDLVDFMNASTSKARW